MTDVPPIPPIPEAVTVALAGMGIELEPGDAERLRGYLEALCAANERFNLTATSSVVTTKPSNNRMPSTVPVHTGSPNARLTRLPVAKEIARTGFFSA